MVKTNIVPEDAVRRRAIDFIKKNWGGLGDLPEPLIPVVWVTVYPVYADRNDGGSRGGHKRTCQKYANW
jgi:hypothetical protein